MDSVLKQSWQKFVTVGTVYENALKMEECDIKVRIKKNGEETEKNVKGQRISGALSIKTNHGVHVLRVFCQTPMPSGDDSFAWLDALTMLNLTPTIKCPEGKQPDMVEIEGQIDINDYLNKKGGLSSALQWKANKCTILNPNEDMKTGTTLAGNFYIQSIKPEIIKDEETDRLVMTVYSIKYDGTVFPISLLVEADMTDDVEENCEPGMTISLSATYNVRELQGKSSGGSRKRFGRESDVSINKPLVIREILFDNGEIIDEPDELVDDDGNEIKTSWINPKAMKKAISLRNEHLEEIKNGGGEKKKSAPKKTTTTTTTTKKSTPVPSPSDDDNFDDEEDY